MNGLAASSGGLARLRDFFSPLDCDSAEFPITSFELACEAARKLASALDLNRTHILAGVRGLASALANALDVARRPGPAIDRAGALKDAAVGARDLVAALDSVFAEACDVVCGLGGGPALDRARDFARDIALHRDLADGLSRYLDSHSTAAPGELVDESARSTSGRVLVLAVRVLPVSQRARYQEEWRGELREMGDAPRRKQLGYAVRVLIRTPKLRWVLSDPVHRVGR